MTDYTPYLLVLVGGGIGGFVYDYANGLFSVSTELSAAYHVVAGAIAAYLSVVSSVLVPPTDYASWAALLAVGYAGTDVLDSFVGKLQSAKAASTPPTAAAGPPTPPS